MSVVWLVLLVLVLVPSLGIFVALLIDHAWRLYPDQDSALTELFGWMKRRSP